MILAVCLAGISKTASAANACPWINEATASGLLGGDSVGSYTEAGNGQPALCVFTQQVAGGLRELRIAVEIAPDPHARLAEAERGCGSDAAPLRAIGNEAVFCMADERRGTLGEQVLGRVRDKVFVIRMTSSVKDDPILTREALKNRISTAAEQVSGNLF